LKNLTKACCLHYDHDDNWYQIEPAVAVWIIINTILFTYKVCLCMRNLHLLTTT